MPSLEEQQLAARQLADAVWHTVNHVEHGNQRHRIQKPSPIVFELQKFDPPGSQSSPRTLQNESVESFYVDLGKGNLTNRALAEEVVQSRHRHPLPLITGNRMQRVGPGARAVGVEESMTALGGEGCAKGFDPLLM